MFYSGHGSISLTASSQIHGAVVSGESPEDTSSVFFNLRSNIQPHLLCVCARCIDANQSPILDLASSLCGILSYFHFSPPCWCLHMICETGPAVKRSDLM